MDYTLKKFEWWRSHTSCQVVPVLLFSSLHAGLCFCLVWLPFGLKDSPKALILPSLSKDVFTGCIILSLMGYFLPFGTLKMTFCCLLSCDIYREESAIILLLFSLYGMSRFPQTVLVTPCCCDKIFWQRQLKGEKVCLGSQFRITVCRCQGSHRNVWWLVTVSTVKVQRGVNALPFCPSQDPSLGSGATHSGPVLHQST